jgi:hypothetical protein
MSASLLVLFLVVGCSDPLPLPTLQEKWEKVKAVNVEDSTVDELVSKLGAPYRSNDGQIGRSRFWYPFEGVTSANTKATAAMLIVTLDDRGAITSYMRSEPVLMPNDEMRIVLREYKVKIKGTWTRHEFKTVKGADG